LLNIPAGSIGKRISLRQLTPLLNYRAVAGATERAT
jgi:hypothetical protein